MMLTWVIHESVMMITMMVVVVIVVTSVAVDAIAIYSTVVT